MLVDVAWRTFISFGLGIAVGLSAWWLVPYKRRILRAIDLLSYALTLIALGSGLFSVRLYEERWNASLDRLDVNSAVSDNGFDEIMGLYKVCPDTPHAPFQPTKKKRDECHRLLE